MTLFSQIDFYWPQLNIGLIVYVESSTLDVIWRENVLISGRYPSPYKLVL